MTPNYDITSIIDKLIEHQGPIDEFLGDIIDFFGGGKKNSSQRPSASVILPAEKLKANPQRDDWVRSTTPGVDTLGGAWDSTIADRKRLIQRRNPGASDTSSTRPDVLKHGLPTASSTGMTKNKARDSAEYLRQYVKDRVNRRAKYGYGEVGKPKQ